MVFRLGRWFFLGSPCDGVLVDMAFKTALTFGRGELETVVDPNDEYNTVLITPGVFGE